MPYINSGNTKVLLESVKVNREELKTMMGYCYLINQKLLYSGMDACDRTHALEKLEKIREFLENASEKE